MNLIKSIPQVSSPTYSGKRGHNPTAVSLFAGAGGCSLGFQQAGFEVLLATDVDSDAVASYRHNFPGTQCEVADVRDLGPEICAATQAVP